MKTANDGSEKLLETAIRIRDGAVHYNRHGVYRWFTTWHESVDLGRTISVPVGPETLGRVFNVLGSTIDLKGTIPQKDFTRHEIT